MLLSKYSENVVTNSISSLSQCFHLPNGQELKVEYQKKPAPVQPVNYHISIEIFDC